MLARVQIARIREIARQAQVTGEELESFPYYEHLIRTGSDRLEIINFFYAGLLDAGVMANE
tara:strand:+ start:101 stop:283 length:183 start_codon:yes stop_codon:yes gene_type:complete